MNRATLYVAARQHNESVECLSLVDLGDEALKQRSSIPDSLSRAIMTMLIEGVDKVSPKTHLRLVSPLYLNVGELRKGMNSDLSLRLVQALNLKQCTFEFRRATSNDEVWEYLDSHA